MSSGDPGWLDWLNRLDSDAAIERLASRPVIPVQNLRAMRLEEALERLESAWQNVFILGPRKLGILRQLVGRAQRFSDSVYPSLRDYYRLREREAECVLEPLPIGCLSGLAGVSKSSLIDALERVCRVSPTGAYVCTGAKLVLQPVRRIRIRAHLSLSAVLMALANPLAVQGRGKWPAEVLHAHVRDWLLATGTAILVIDEMQFLTQSVSASTRVTQLVMALADLGFPTLFVANYSLVHKLMLRSQEDKDRLLGSPLLLQPPAADSTLWRAVIDEYVRVSPESFRISACEHAGELHRLTAGLFRALKRLLCEAYREAVGSGRSAVSIDDVRRAYRNEGFSSHRKDIEDLASLAVSPLLEIKRQDLVCPFAPVRSFASVQSIPDSASRRAPVMDARASLLESSMSVGARAVLQELRDAARGADVNGKGTVTRLTRRTVPISAQSLQDGARLVRKKMILARKPAPTSATLPVMPKQEAEGHD